jgi:hypothetical protein
MRTNARAMVAPPHAAALLESADVAARARGARLLLAVLVEFSAGRCSAVGLPVETHAAVHGAFQARGAGTAAGGGGGPG